MRGGRSQQPLPSGESSSSPVLLKSGVESICSGSLADCLSFCAARSYGDTACVRGLPLPHCWPAMGCGSLCRWTWLRSKRQTDRQLWVSFLSLLSQKQQQSSTASRRGSPIFDKTTQSSAQQDCFNYRACNTPPFGLDVHMENTPQGPNAFALKFLSRGPCVTCHRGNTYGGTEVH